MKRKYSILNLSNPKYVFRSKNRKDIKTYLIWYELSNLDIKEEDLYHIAKKKKGFNLKYKVYKKLFQIKKIGDVYEVKDLKGKILNCKSKIYATPAKIESRLKRNIIESNS